MVFNFLCLAHAYFSDVYTLELLTPHADHPCSRLNHWLPVSCSFLPLVLADHTLSRCHGPRVHLSTEARIVIGCSCQGLGDTVLLWLSGSVGCGTRGYSSFVGEEGGLVFALQFYSLQLLLKKPWDKTAYSQRQLAK